MRASVSAALQSPLGNPASNGLGLSLKLESKLPFHLDRVHIFGPAVALQASPTA